jgi:general L-amino acid transport system permease protein
MEPFMNQGAPVAFWRDLRFLRVAAQVIFIVVIVALLVSVITNIQSGLQQAGIGTSFDFLSRPSNFQIDEGLSAEPHRREDSYANAFLVGFINTARVLVVGLVGSMLLGLVMGVARLSNNWLARNIAMVFIEVMQNTPLLVQLLFLATAIKSVLPPVRDAFNLPGPSYLSVKGLATPALVPTANTPLWLGIAAGGLLIGLTIWGRLRKQRVDSGKNTNAPQIGLAIIFGVGAIAWLVLSLSGTPPYTISVPEIGRFSYAENAGAVLTPEFVIISLGLILYTGAFIAEIVRSGIQAVAYGQWEAGRAAGFTYFQTLRLIILPQAFRVMIPPLTNQFLNLAKNSTLGTAVGFFELFGVARTSAESIPIVPLIIIVMVTYLVLNVIIAMIMNIFNSRFQFKTR